MIASRFVIRCKEEREDEWDYIFHQEFVTDADKKSYIRFLSNLIKDKPYVSLAYMTGILPIAKYSSGSELNMFIAFTMAKSPAFSDYFGFTEKEVDELFKRYMENCSSPAVTREGIREWYDGYHTASGERVYNPRSVVYALQYNNLESFWTSAGPYDEIFSAMVVYGFLSYNDGKVNIPNRELMGKFADMFLKSCAVEL